MSAPRILVVDDEPGVASLMGTWLRRQGYNTTVVMGVEQARAIDARVTFDLIVSDVRMPGGGVEAIRELWPLTPVVTVSGLITGADVLKDEHFLAELVRAVREKLTHPPDAGAPP